MEKFIVIKNVQIIVLMKFASAKIVAVQLHN